MFSILRVGSLEYNESDLSFENIGATFDIDSRFKDRTVTGYRENPVGGLFSPAYGVVNHCTTINVNAVIKLPTNITNRFRLNS